jgi:hypothetical protein
MSRQLVGWPQIEGHVSRGRAERLEALGYLEIGTDAFDRRVVSLAALVRAFALQRAGVKAAQRRGLLLRGGRPHSVCVQALKDERAEALARGVGGPFGLPAAMTQDDEGGDK